MKLYTLGFGGKNAENFFSTLELAGVKTLVDIRLNNRSQLAGFTKAGDLEFFLAKISGITYCHYPQLAPEKELLEAIRSKKIDWDVYTQRFEALLQQRKADSFLKKELKTLTMPLCLLCSEPEATYCHRRLVAERIQKLFPKTEIIHL